MAWQLPSNRIQLRRCRRTNGLPWRGTSSWNCRLLSLCRLYCSYRHSHHVTIPSPCVQWSSSRAVKKYGPSRVTWPTCQRWAQFSQTAARLAAYTARDYAYWASADGQAELTSVAGNIPRCLIRRQTATRSRSNSNNRPWHVYLAALTRYR